MSEYKPFDKSLYEENNQSAIKTSIDFIQQIFHYQPTAPAGEAYKSHDFIVNDPSTNKDVRVEAEVKKVWEKTGVWQGYDTIDVPYRKKDSRAHLFIMINKHHNTLLCLPMSEIKRSIVKQKRTIYTHSGTEQFFAVPLSKAIFFKKNDSSWIRIK